MSYHRDRGILMACVVVAVGGCLTPKHTPTQRRALTIHIVQAPFDVAYRGTLNVLQDRGFTIDNLDRESGLIVASQRSSRGKRISCVITSFGESSTEIRVFIGDRGGKRTVYKSEPYRKLFNKISVEVARLNAVAQDASAAPGREELR